MLMGDFVTAVRYKLPIKVVIMKNNTLGRIKREQMVFLGDNLDEASEPMARWSSKRLWILTSLPCRPRLPRGKRDTLPNPSRRARPIARKSSMTYWKIRFGSWYKIER
jgi:thiamine pyrophosphate-dependent enzyme